MVLEGILLSWATGKGLDKLSGALGNKVFGNLQERTVKRVFIEARQKLKKSYKKLWAKLYQQDCWEAAEEEIALFLDPNTNGQPDVRKIAKIVSPVDGLNDDEVIAGLEHFFEYVRKELSQQPDILIVESLRTALGIKEDIRTLCEQLNIVQDIAVLDEKAHKASSADMGKFVFERGYSSLSDTVPLSLYQAKECSHSPIDDGELLLSLIASKTIILEAGPGAGKTTTLLALAQKLLKTGTSCIPVYVPLPEWEASDSGLFEYIQIRDAFNQSLSVQNIQALASHGHLVLLLDGWNELAGEPLKKARYAIAQLCRDYPNIGVVIATRKTAPPPTKEEKTVFLSISDLNREQRAKLIKQEMGDKEGEAVIQKIYDNRELDELSRIPLYLRILLDVAGENAMPETKEQLLCQFVQKHENLLEHKDALAKIFSETHELYLEDLAVAIMEADSTTLSNEKARPVVKSTAEKLQAQGQISQIPHLDNVLSCLADHHLLVKDENSAWRFQHHQFQEWFLSKYIEQKVLAAVLEDNDEAQKEIRHVCLNIPRWEEAVLFVSECLSRKNDEGVQVVAQMVRWGLEIDPLLSAEIIYRSHSNVWEAVKSDVVQFINSWHTPGKDDRALAFMIASGRPEFSDLVFTCITDPDSQIHLRALRRYKPFRVSVLGDGWIARLENVSERVRATVVSEIITNGGWSGMTAGTEAAISIPCPATKINALGALRFCQSKQHIEKLLKNTPDDEYDRLIEKIEPHDIPDAPDLRDYIIQNLHKRLDGETEPNSRLRILLQLLDWGVTDVWPQIFDNFSGLEKEEDNRQFLYNFLTEASRTNPERTSSAIIKRMLSGREIGHGWENFIIGADRDERSGLAKLVHDGVFVEHSHKQKIALGLFQAEELKPFLETFLDVAVNQNGSYQRLRYILCDANSMVLIEAILALCPLNEPETIGELASLLSWHGEDNKRSRFLVPPDIEDRFREELKNWIAILNESVDTSLRGLADIAVILGRIGHHDDLAIICQLLDKNTETKNRQREEWKAIGYDQSRQPPGVFMCHLNRYREAFEMMAAHPDLPETIAKYLRIPEFAKEAAYVLRDRWVKENRNWQEEQTGPFSNRPDYSQAAEMARQLESGKERPEPDYLSSIILKRIEELLPDKNEEKSAQILVDLCSAVADMDYGNKHPLIKEVMEIEGYYFSKRCCLTKLAEKGETLDATIVEAGCRTTLERWLPDAWNNHNDWYQVREWLDLFAFSGSPLKTLEILKELPDNLLHTYHLRDLCYVLPYSPHDDAGTVLLGLAEIKPDIIGEYYWVRACGNQINETLKAFFLEALWEVQKLGRVASAHSDRDAFVEIMVHIFKNDPDALNNLKQKMSEPLPDIPVQVLTKIVEEMSEDEELVFSALNMLSNESKTASRYVRNMICNVAKHNKPIGESNGMYHMYEIVPTGINDLRRKLFEIMHNDQDRNIVAEKILKNIDDLRDEYGRPPREPRHPFIESAKPWPQILKKNI